MKAIKKLIPNALKKKIKEPIKKLKYRVKEDFIVPYEIRKKPKIFCIGKNKTGTTSFKEAFLELGYRVGNQRKAELLLREYKSGNFKSIVRYCKTAQVFQDFPFSSKDTYKYMDKAFPNAKFILTVRDSPEQWYESSIGFYSKIYGEGRLPTKKDLQNSNYVWKGWAWEVKQMAIERAGLPEDDLYNKEILTQAYIDYNKEVIEYFKDRKDKLLVLNVGEKGSYRKMIDFLNIKSSREEFPWKNKTKEVKINYKSKTTILK